MLCSVDANGLCDQASEALATGAPAKERPVGWRGQHTVDRLFDGTSRVRERPGIPGPDPSQLSSMATDRIIDVGFALSSPWRSGFVIRAGSATASMQMTSRFVLPVATITTS